jgi:hypothetical protein
MLHFVVAGERLGVALTAPVAGLAMLSAVAATMGAWRARRRAMIKIVVWYTSVRIAVIGAMNNDIWPKSRFTSKVTRIVMDERRMEAQVSRRRVLVCFKSPLGVDAWGPSKPSRLWEVKTPRSRLWVVKMLENMKE